METTVSTLSANANDRDVSWAEREKIAQTLQSIGCNRFGDAEYYPDKKRFEVDDVVCENGQKYEIYLDQSYRVMKKELEDH
ncbi:MAG: hypothetical protein RLZZ568_1391 [Cyanobacteriota bacterium]